MDELASLAADLHLEGGETERSGNCGFETQGTGHIWERRLFYCVPVSEGVSV